MSVLWVNRSRVARDDQAFDDQPIESSSADAVHLPGSVNAGRRVMLSSAGCPEQHVGAVMLLKRPPRGCVVCGIVIEGLFRGFRTGVTERQQRLALKMAPAARRALSMRSTPPASAWFEDSDSDSPASRRIANTQYDANCAGPCYGRAVVLCN